MKIIYSFILLLCLSVTLSAQVTRTSFLRTTEIMSGFHMQTWSTESDQSISEITIPFGVVFPVNKNFTLTALSNSAYATLDPGAGKLSGFTDTRISGTYILMKDHLLLTAGIAVPTGKTAIDKEQNDIAAALATYPLSFHVPSFGQGLSFNGAGYYAFEVKNMVLGLGAGLVYKNGFEPLVGSDQVYKPGMEISVNAGAEYKTSNVNGTRFTIDVNYTMYGADEYGDQEILKSGSRIDVDLRTIFKLKSADIIIFLSERTKGKNERGLGTLLPESKNSNGNQLEIGGIGLFPLNDKFSLKGLADLKLYSANEYESNGATIVGFGGGLNYLLMNNLSLDLTLKYSTGSLINKNDNTSVTGFDIFAGLKYGF